MNYNELSVKDLRSLLLDGNLSHEFMTEEDYTALLDAEADIDEPSEKVIDFCYAGLSFMSKYDDINKRDFNLNELFQTGEKKHRHSRKLKRAVIIIAAAVVAMIITQIVASALGFDLFGYIFNWNKPEVVAVMNNDNGVKSDSENAEKEYSTVEEIPLEIKKLVPEYMFNTFSFYNAVYTKQDDNIINQFYFLYNNEKLLYIYIGDVSDITIEKDDFGYYEEYTHGKTVFTVFTNMGNYQAMWIKDNNVYVFYTCFDEPKKLKDILDNLY